MDEFSDKKFILKIGDKEWEVKFDFTSFLGIEEKYGSLTDMFVDYNKKRFQTILDLLYLVLKNTNSDFTKKYKDKKEFAKDLDSKKIDEYDKILADALNDAFPSNLKKE